MNHQTLIQRRRTNDEGEEAAMAKMKPSKSKGRERGKRLERWEASVCGFGMKERWEARVIFKFERERERLKENNNKKKE